MIKNKMKRKRLIILVFLVLASSVFALNSDFNNDNKIDFDDFFLFADQYGKNVDANNVKFDLDKNGKIDVEDFFIFADNFGVCKDVAVCIKPDNTKGTCISGVDENGRCECF